VLDTIAADSKIRIFGRKIFYEASMGFELVTACSVEKIVAPQSPEVRENTLRSLHSASNKIRQIFSLRRHQDRQWHSAYLNCRAGMASHASYLQNVENAIAALHLFRNPALCAGGEVHEESGI
jgi:hypothetical protein